MIAVTPDLVIPESEIQERFVRASGPGGQNVNKVSTAVQLRFNVYSSSALPEYVRGRLIRLEANRINSAGELIIDAQRYRTQAQNRADARARLAALIRNAAHKPKARRKTAPSAAAKRQRLEGKRKRGETKRARSAKLDLD